jgi:hypothetical protein
MAFFTGFGLAYMTDFYGEGTEDFTAEFFLLFSSSILALKSLTSGLFLTSYCLRVLVRLGFGLSF